MKFEILIFKLLRKLFYIRSSKRWYSDRYVQYFNQDANDFVRASIQSTKNGLMITKWGTTELNTVNCFFSLKNGIHIKDYIQGLRGYKSIFPEEVMNLLCSLSGFFPNDIELGYRFAELMLEDLQYIDILGSYAYQEKYLEKELGHCAKVNLDGYYAPFLWSNPWTMELKNKKVLIVHPFVDTIQKQYNRRDKLFNNPDVLPEFKDIILVKAIQTIAGNLPEQNFLNWFDALENMKSIISSKEFDIALIGCGAYGMPLAAHIKRMGKIAVHLAGWTQMLFGIYGNRWINDQPEYAKFINKYWVRPSDNERPKNSSIVENSCYW